MEVVAIVLTPWPAEPTAIERSNRETIESLGEVEVATLGQIDLDDPGNWSVEWRFMRHMGT